ncbi:MAG: serine protease [Rubrivivax sp.]|nr:MAG: serine protease [Rubrivivax sp.]
MVMRWMCRFGLAALMIALSLGARAQGPDSLDAVEDQIIVAVRDAPEPFAAPGATPRADYRHVSGYAGSARSAALAAELARDHGLTETSFWTIDPLHWRCMLYRLRRGDSAKAVLARLNSDPRVQLAQPLNQFETLAEARPEPYNDPYLKLQRGFTGMGTAQAHRVTRGGGVVVALIDSAVDAAHPDLAGRVASQRDFVAESYPVSSDEKHGTEMAGIIAAAANNHLGIVGMAPEVRLLAYRACWSTPASPGASRCDSFTLARALGAAIAAGADVINLSLGGPADPLLEQLAAHAIKQGAIVVGAVPPSGRLAGFPLQVPGVLAVAPDDDPVREARVLRAPGRDVLTLVPGGRYDFASGGSLAAAHATGAVALLRALDPGLRAAGVQALLGRTPGSGASGGQVRALDVCAAVRQLRPEASCAGATPHE